MSAEDDQDQSGYEEGNFAGPGAPTPLSALEVSLANVSIHMRRDSNAITGCQWPHNERHQAHNGGWI